MDGVFTYIALLSISLVSALESLPFQMHFVPEHPVVPAAPEPPALRIGVIIIRALPSAKSLKT